jgi:hypothetical protein
MPHRRTAILCLVALAAAACGPSPILGIDWGRAPSVERPVNYDATLPPSDDPDHPILRIPGQAYMVDVATMPQGGEVAVGYIPPAWTPASWTSPDAATWTLHSMAATPFTFPVAVAAGGSAPRIVAVGRSGKLPIAWTSSEGASWQAHDVPILGTDGTAERMTSVVGTEQGFIAGGSVGPELAERHARFWRSDDGVAWQPVPDDPQAFDNAEVRAITSTANGFVAVGVVGTAQQASGAVAWTSSDGNHWSRIDDPAFAGGVAVSVIVAPFGGLVAVGSDVARHNAMAWTSPDGHAWTRAPDEPSRQYANEFIWMTDVTAIGDQVLAVGEFQGLQRGTATSWISKDGLHWEQAKVAPVQEQGEFYAVVPGGPGVIAVGSYGAPDSYVPTVWVSPGR